MNVEQFEQHGNVVQKHREQHQHDLLNSSQTFWIHNNGPELIADRKQISDKKDDKVDTRRSSSCLSPRRRKQAEVSRRGKRIGTGHHQLNTVPMLFAIQQQEGDKIGSPTKPKATATLKVDPPGLLLKDLKSHFEKEKKKKKRDKRSHKSKSSSRKQEESTVVNWIRCNDSVASELEIPSPMRKPLQTSASKRSRAKRNDEPREILPDLPTSTIVRDHTTIDDQTSTTTSSSSRRSCEEGTEKSRPSAHRGNSFVLQTPKKESRRGDKIHRSGSSLNFEPNKSEPLFRISQAAAASSRAKGRPSYSVKSHSADKLSLFSPSPVRGPKLLMVKTVPRTSKESRMPVCAPPLDFSEFEADDFSVSPATRNGENSDPFSLVTDGAIQW